MRTLLFAVCALFAICFVHSVSAQIPRTISYQGVISLTGGAPISDGSHVITINLYTAATGGTSIFTESHNTQTRNGLFNVVLGSVIAIPDSLTFDIQYFLGVAVDGGAEMTPRTPLTSVPYALRAKIADLAEGISVNAKGVVTSINEIDGSFRILGDSTISVTRSGQAITLHAIGGAAFTGVSVTSPITGNGLASNPLAIPQANVLTNGYLSAVDFRTFNDKLSTAAVTSRLIGDGTAANPLDIAQQGATNGQVLTWNGGNWAPANGGLTSVAANLPITGNGTLISPLNLAQANATTNGYLSGADWTTFNNKLTTVATDATLAGTGTTATPLKIAPQGATTGQALVWNGSTWLPANVLNAVAVTAPITGSGTTADPLAMAAANGTTNGHLTSTDWTTFNNKLSLVAVTPRLTGNGTTALPLDIAQQGATSGQVLKWNGTNWVPAADAGMTSVLVQTPELSGTGVTGDPVKLAPQGATSGQVLKWNGTNWLPASDAGLTSVSVTAPITGNGTTSSPLAIAQANGTTNGYLTSTDWTTFNNKLSSVAVTARLTGTGTTTNPLDIAQQGATNGQVLTWNGATWAPANTLTSVSANAPITGNGSTSNPLTLAQANGSTNGYLTSTDWTTFNNKLSSVAVTARLTGTGTTANPLDIAQQGATNGQVLTWNGASWIPANALVAVIADAPIQGDGTAANHLRMLAANATTNGYLTSTDWTTFNNKLSSVAVTARLIGDGTTANPLDIAQQGATNGQALTWNGTTWTPGIPSATVVADAPIQGDGTAANHLRMSAASGTTNGYLTSTDWTTFNNKLSSVAVTARLIGDGTTTNPLDIAQQGAANGQVLTWNGTTWLPANGGLTSVSATAPITGNGTTGNPLAMASANGTTNGYLTSTDWNTFNNKLSTVAVTARLIGDGTTANPLDIAQQGATNGQVLTWNGTNWLPTTVSATVIADAPITGDGSAANHLTIAASSGSTNGYLTSTDWTTFNNKLSTVAVTARLTGDGTAANPLDIAAQGATNGQVLSWNGTTWVPANASATVTASAPITGDGSAANPLTIAAANGSTNGYLTSTDWTTFNNKLSTVAVTARLTGDGTTTNPLDIAQQGATNGQVLTWNGTTWLPTTISATVIADAPITGDGSAANHLAIAQSNGTTNGYLSSTDWTTFNNKLDSVFVTARLSGNGTSANPLDIAQQGATSGQVLTWDGSNWVPDDVPDASDGWSLDGNAGTVDGTNFLGTTDDVPFTIRVNDLQAVRIEPTRVSPNIIHGYEENFVDAGIVGGTVSGGGQSGEVNSVLDDFSTVSGGVGNTAGSASNRWATVGGGRWNTASGVLSTVGGGEGNSATNDVATIAGGKANTAEGQLATVGGGSSNTALADGATISGGEGNLVEGIVSTISGGSGNTIVGEASAIAGGSGLNLGNYSFGFNGDPDGANDPTDLSSSDFDGSAYFGNVNLMIGNVDGAARELKFYEANTNRSYPATTNFTAMRAQAQANDITYVLPSAIGSANQMLSVASVSGSTATLTWAAVGSSSEWHITGNAGTTPGTNFLGTTDAQDLLFRTTNVDKLRILAAGNILIPKITTGAQQLQFQNPLGTFNTTFAAGAQTATIDYTLPITAPTANQVLSATAVAGSAVTLGWANGSGTAWNLTGNAGTTPGNNFLGTTDNQPMYIQVKNALGVVLNSLIMNTNGSIQRDNLGNARGVFATDLQQLRAGVTQVASGNYSMVAGGQNNTASGVNSSVMAGIGNIASGAASVVGGGTTNTASGSSATVAGGINNVASGTFWASVGGGSRNVAGGVSSTVSGGDGNQATGIISTVGGGQANIVSSAYGNVAGGYENIVSGNTSTIAGGTRNIISGPNSGSLSGDSNNISGSTSSIGGGHRNIIQSDRSTVPGGSGMTLATGSDGSFGFLGNNAAPYSKNMSISAANTAVFGNTNLWLANNDNTARELRFYEANSANGAFPPAGINYSAFKAGVQTVNITYTLPTDTATADGQVLSSTTKGVLSWVNSGATTSWSLTGNAGTSTTTNFLGTTDNVAMQIQVKNAALVNNSLILNPNGSIQRDAGGNARGVNAIDLQISRTLATNVASGLTSTISGGDANTASAELSTVSGGGYNSARGYSSVIGGGANNIVNNEYSTVGGGYQNTVSGNNAVISGGVNNVAGGISSSVGGGSTNTANGINATIGGGYQNTVNGTNSTVGGGHLNVVNGAYATAGGGENIVVSGSYAAVAGGNVNTASGSASAIGGGNLNVASGGASVVSGGSGNTVSGNYSAIAGGRGLTLTDSGSFGFLGNNFTGANSMIVNDGNTVVFGNTNLWLANNTNTSSQLRFYEANAIPGAFPLAATNYTAFKAGAQTLDITYTLPFAVPATNGQVLSSTTTGVMSWTAPIDPTAWHITGNAGTSPTINFIGTNDMADVAFEIHVSDSNSANGGRGRVMRYQPNASSANLIGGYNGNTVSPTSVGVTISGGGANFFPQDAASDYTTIGGGKGHVIAVGQVYGTIGGGSSNQILAAAFGGGSYIGGGTSNKVISQSATIVAGISNTANASYSFIGGGSTNSIGVTGSIVNGQYSVLGGGNSNTITGNYSTLVGGANNSVLGSYSVIPGGKGLTISDSGSFGFLGDNNLGVRNMTINAPNTAVFGNTHLWLANNTNAASELRFYEANAAIGAFPGVTNYTAFKAGLQASDITYTLPTTPALVQSALINDGSGNLSWASTNGAGATGWSLVGNSLTTPGTVNYLGTSDNQAFEIHVHHDGAATEGRRRVMRFEPNTVSANIIGGHNANSVDAGVIGATIAGGGLSGTQNNQVKGNYSTIGGGFLNRAGSTSGTIATIAGGRQNTASGDMSVIGGGNTNTASGANSTVAGGTSDTASGYGSSIGGGSQNKAKEWMTTVAGGEYNIATGTIATQNAYSTVGGGRHNHAIMDYATISGGSFNKAVGQYTFIGGGSQDSAIGDYSVVGGGQSNKSVGRNSAVLGGRSNFAIGDTSVIGGGYQNTTSGINSVISGGTRNTASGFYATILGGRGLTLSDSGSFGYLGKNTGANDMTISAKNTAVFGNTDLWLANNTNAASGLRFYEANSTASGAFPPTNLNYTAFKAGAQTADITYTLPTAAPATTHRILSSSTSGQMSWAPALDLDSTNARLGVNAASPSTTVDVGGDIALRENAITLTNATENNLAIGNFSFITVDPAADRTITGIDAGVDGKMVVICNLSGNSITFKHADGGSDAANRILCENGANVTIGATNGYGCVTLIYSASAASGVGRWMVMSKN